MTRKRTRDTASSSEWRPKRTQELRHENRSINPYGMERMPVNRARESETPRGMLKRDNIITTSKRDAGEVAIEGSESRRTNSEAHDLGKNKWNNTSMEAASKEIAQDESMNKNTGEQLLTSNLDQGLVLENNHNIGQETEMEREEREAMELEKSIDEYAALAMTDEMVNADDILDDMAELDEQNRDVAMEDGRIEAISQLSPERQNSTTNGTGAMTSKAAPQEVEKGELIENNNNKKDQKNTQTSQQTTTL
ncbi:hypothetical protein F2Q70_00026382 [Brassica cretica]|uniref:Uncharacterized protein n=1 Tax=Brassica cretica TaxID=69181 RepID=A0A8S9L9C3_BRACR|nr:hypothetical protein F2Q68_00025937 [Brassica cretica]KAF2602567.1 hypothetical protein F2Q70_00026382 [Brassica cretica]